MNRKHLLLVLLATFCVLVVLNSPFDASAQDSTAIPFDSPLDPPEPTPISTPLSKEAANAVRYLTEQQQIAATELQVIGDQSVHFAALNRTYHYVVVTRAQGNEVQEFSVFVDPATSTVEPDIAGVLQAEQSAHAAKFGKLHPDLYTRLQTAQEDEKLQAAIWVTYTVDSRQPNELAVEVAALYPEAAAALQERGVPWEVDDSTLSETIWSVYRERLQANVAQRVDPLIAWLREQGWDATKETTIPIVLVTLTKAEIEKVANHPLVEQIYLNETESAPASDIATATSRIPPVWQRGYNGTGIDIAVVETGLNRTGTNINTTAGTCLTVPAVFDSSLPDGDHQSRVAAIAACNNDARPGVAKGARIFDGGYDPDNHTFAQVMNWAAANADIINVSMSIWPAGSPNSTTPMLEDRVADYYARFLYKTVVVAAGNTVNREGTGPFTSVSSPGKGWNVLTVGNLDDRNNAYWAATAPGTGDVIYGTSSHVNPSTGVEKPDLAAPGTSIDTVAGQETGTSYAAPQVSGVAALLMQRNGNLTSRPEAVRAILLASAVHNVRDSRIMPAGQDLYDGAGGIDARLADDIASLTGGVNNNSNICSRPCWWATDGLSVAPGGNVSRAFHAVRGERIRVAIAWFSMVDPLYIFDNLSVNYNLQVHDQDNTLVGYSASTLTV